MSDPTTPTETDLDTIRERHVRYEPSTIPWQAEPDPNVCASCHKDWPCDTRVVLDALDEDRIASALLRETKAQTAEKAARADADRLAEALQHVYGAWRVDHDGKKWPLAHNALRQHDEKPVTHADPSLAADLALAAAVRALGEDFDITSRSQSRYGHAVHVQQVGHRPYIAATLDEAIEKALSDD